MRTWLQLFGGLLIWAAHFAAVYAAVSLAEVIGDESIARLGVLIATTAAATAALCLFLAARGARNPTRTSFVEHVTRLGASVAIVAIMWQALPVLLAP